MTTTPGRRHAFGLTDSTNERAFAAIAAGNAKHGDWFVAEEQTAGRGRRGRRWHSPSGAGLYISLVYKPNQPLPAAGPSMAAGLGVLDCVHALGLNQCYLKWPNDLLIEEAKLAGILVETRGWDPHHPAYVIGVGLNLTPGLWPRELHDERAVTSLGGLGVDQAADEVEATLLRHLWTRLTQASAGQERDLCRDYLQGLRIHGRPVRALAAGSTFEGQVTDLQLSTGVTLTAPDGSSSEIALEFLEQLEPIC